MTRRQLLLTAAAAGLSQAAPDPLLNRWREIAGSTEGTLGAAVLFLKSGQLADLNGEQHFPLCSVCKLPLAMNALAMVEEGKLRLDQEIEVLPSEVWPGVSEIAKQWPARRRFPLTEILQVMVANSDNTAEETMYRVGGGSAAMAARFKQWRIDGMRIDRTERQCARDRSGPTPEAQSRAMLRDAGDPRDSGTPKATVQLFARLFRGELLSAASTTRLIDILKSTDTGGGRLKGLLPKGTVVAHKTGSSGSANGFTEATNDSGVIYHPRTGEIAISVYLKSSRASQAQRDHAIATIARAAFDAA